MKRTTRRRLELFGTCIAGGFLPPLGPILGMKHADRWPVDMRGRYHGPIRKHRR